MNGLEGVVIQVGLGFDLGPLRVQTLTLFNLHRSTDSDIPDNLVHGGSPRGTI